MIRLIWRCEVVLAAGALLCAACTTAPGAPVSVDAVRYENAAAAESVAAARQIILAAKEESQAPALSVSVLRDGAIVWSEAFGLADIEQSVPASRASLYRIGSVSKALTASLAARLADEGVIDLDTDIRETLPTFPDKGAPITLRQLLGHLGGIRHYKGKDFNFGAPGGMINTRPYATDDEINALYYDDPLVSSPGEKFNYSTFGYTLIGDVLEAATGRDYYDLLSEYVLTPAGAETTQVDNMFSLIRDRVSFYDHISAYEGFLPSEMGPVINAYPLNSAYKIPGGGLIGSADDMVRIGALHFDPGFLSPEMFAQVFTSQRNGAGEETGTGLGWRVEKDESGRTIYHHRGTQTGSRAFLIVYPEEKTAIAILSNLNARPGNIKDIAEQIAEAFRQ